MGLTAKDVGRLAKRHPDVIENIGGGHVPRLVDFFLEDLRIGKVVVSAPRSARLGSARGVSRPMRILLFYKIPFPDVKIAHE